MLDGLTTSVATSTARCPDCKRDEGHGVECEAESLLRKLFVRGEIVPNENGDMHVACLLHSRRDALHFGAAKHCRNDFVDTETTYRGGVRVDTLRRVQGSLLEGCRVESRASDRHSRATSDRSRLWRHGADGASYDWLNNANLGCRRPVVAAYPSASRYRSCHSVRHVAFHVRSTQPGRWYADIIEKAVQSHCAWELIPIDMQRSLQSELRGDLHRREAAHNHLRQDADPQELFRLGVTSHPHGQIECTWRSVGPREWARKQIGPHRAGRHFFSAPGSAKDARVELCCQHGRLKLHFKVNAVAEEKNLWRHAHWQDPRDDLQREGQIAKEQPANKHSDIDDVIDELVGYCRHFDLDHAFMNDSRLAPQGVGKAVHVLHLSKGRDIHIGGHVEVTNRTNGCVQSCLHHGGHDLFDPKRRQHHDRGPSVELCTVQRDVDRVDPSFQCWKIALYGGWADEVRHAKPVWPDSARQGLGVHEALAMQHQWDRLPTGSRGGFNTKDNRVVCEGKDSFKGEEERPVQGK
eukprot:scaffold1484_cov241-Pinguiococcus_pyrenoidosus.AAC.10